MKCTIEGIEYDTSKSRMVDMITTDVTYDNGFEGMEPSVLWSHPDHGLFVVIQGNGCIGFSVEWTVEEWLDYKES